MEANQPERQENVRATRSLSCDSRLRRRHAWHVRKGRLRNGRGARDERGSHEENDPAATLKETLIEGPGYSASRAGRSAGRSLSWHGRGRGFKSHPVHSSWLRIWARTAT